MESQKWYKNLEMIVALSALLIGLVTAFTSIYSAYVDRQYARASVWPRLEIFKSNNSNSFSYGVMNNGSGPALIKYARVKYDSSYIKRWHDIPQFKKITQSHIGTRVIPPQHQVTPISYKGENTQAFLKASKLINIEICYCSIYDECWLIDTDNFPMEVEACSVEEQQKFLQ